jgi:hypothetical protein
MFWVNALKNGLFVLKKSANQLYVKYLQENILLRLI